MRKAFPSGAAMVLCVATGSLGCDEGPEGPVRRTRNDEPSASLAPLQAPKELNTRGAVTNLSDPRPYIVTRRTVGAFVSRNRPQGALPRDGWGVALTIQGEEIRSAGPDRKFNTLDDLPFGLDGKALGPRRPTQQQ